MAGLCSLAQNAMALVGVRGSFCIGRLGLSVESSSHE